MDYRTIELELFSWVGKRFLGSGETETVKWMIPSGDEEDAILRRIVASEFDDEQLNWNWVLDLYHKNGSYAVCRDGDLAMAWAKVVLTANNTVRIIIQRDKHHMTVAGFLRHPAADVVTREAESICVRFVVEKIDALLKEAGRNRSAPDYIELQTTSISVTHPSTGAAIEVSGVEHVGRAESALVYGWEEKLVVRNARTKPWIDKRHVRCRPFKLLKMASEDLCEVFAAMRRVPSGKR